MAEHDDSVVAGAVTVSVLDDAHGAWEVEDLAFLDSVIQDPSQPPLGEVLAGSLLDLPMEQVQASTMTSALALDAPAMDPTPDAGDVLAPVAPSVGIASGSDHNGTKKADEGRRGSNTTGKSTRQKQKEEMAYLRECVKELEAELRALRGASSGGSSRTTSPSDSPSVDEDDSADDTACNQLAKYVSTHETTSPKDLWQTVATHQMEEKQKSEAENARLREMLEEQIRIAKSLEKIFRKRPSTATIQAYEADTKRVRRSEYSANGMYAELTQNLDWRVDHLERVFDLNGLSKLKCNFKYAQARSDDERCVYVEYVDSKIFPFSLSDTQEAIWKCLSLKRLTLPTGLYACAESVDDLTMGQFICKLRRRKTYADVDAKFVCKRFVNEHRVILVWESLTDPEESVYYNSGGVQLREKGWTLVESVDDNGDSKTIVQTAVRFIPEIEISNAQDKYKVGVLSDLMVSAYRENMDGLHRAIENELMASLIGSERSV